MENDYQNFPGESDYNPVEGKQSNLIYMALISVNADFDVLTFFLVTNLPFQNSQIMACPFQKLSEQSK